MLRRNIVLFIRRHKKKLIILLNAILLLLGISFIATIIISTVTKFNLFSSSEEEVNNVIHNKQQTMIYGKDIEKNVYESDEKVIEDFIQYCNKGNTKEAYKMLTDDCKDTYYSTEKEFKELYQEPIFETTKTYDMQSWINSDGINIYKMKIISDLFDKGLKNDGDYIEDYYAVIKEDDKLKLSINKYINRIELNKSLYNNNITINVINKDVYMDYEVYTIQVKNGTAVNIKLDSKETTNSTYLLDNNGVRYSSYMYEVIDSDLLINSGDTKTIKIKFNKMYNPEVNIMSMEFKDIRKNIKVINMSINLE